MAMSSSPAASAAALTVQRAPITVKGESVTQYYHQAAVCQLIGQDLALVLDLELLRPGEGEETAAKRLLKRVFANYPRFFDIVVADALYLDAPFINFCRDRHKHVIVTAKGDHRLLLQHARGLFAALEPGRFGDRRGNVRRDVRYWDEEGFTSCEGVKEPLRVLPPRRRYGGGSGSAGSGWRRRRRRLGHGRRR